MAVVVALIGSEASKAKLIAKNAEDKVKANYLSG